MISTKFYLSPCGLIGTSYLVAYTTTLEGVRAMLFGCVPTFSLPHFPDQLRQSLSYSKLFRGN
jgi:hypothetical protein